MPSLKAADLHQEPASLCGSLLHRDLTGKTEAPGASCGQSVVLLGVQIKQHLSLEPGQIHIGRAVHADLLVHRKERLHRRVLQRLAVQDCQSHGDGDPVIRSQCGILCRHISVLHHQLQRISQEIVIRMFRFFTDHIQMPLDDDRLTVFIPSGSRLFDDHIIPFVLIHFQLPLICKPHAVIADSLCIVRSPWDPANLLKKMKYFLWLDVF